MKAIETLRVVVVVVGFHISISLWAAEPAEVLRTKTGSIGVERLAKLEYPWGMSFLPDGRLLITEKPGRLRIFADGKLSEPVNGVPKVAYRGQGGLLDVEIDPKFDSNHLVYLYFVEPADQQPSDARLVPDPRLGPGVDKEDNVLKGGAVARGKLEGNDLREVMVIWRQVPKTIGLGHFGGRLVFAPDGKLFITSGERQRFDPASDMTSNLGKIVRIHSDGSIPQDNPFANSTGARPDIWTLGHRNPLGAVINPGTKQLWINEMGPAHGDELNIVESGRNYGWPIVSNGDNYDGTLIPKHATRTEFTPPAYYWHPSVAPSGMIVYTGDRFKEWKNNILLGGLVTEALVRLKIEGDRVKTEERINLHRRIRDVIQALDGAVLLITDSKDGELLRLSPTEKVAL